MDAAPSQKKNEIVLASEQVQVISQIVDKLFISAHTNNDIGIILNQEQNVFADIIQDLHGLSQRRDEKLYQLMLLVGKKNYSSKKKQN